MPVSESRISNSLRLAIKLSETICGRCVFNIACGTPRACDAETTGGVVKKCTRCAKGHHKCEAVSLRKFHICHVQADCSDHSRAPRGKGRQSSDAVEEREGSFGGCRGGLT